MVVVMAGSLCIDVDLTLCMNCSCVPDNILLLPPSLTLLLSSSPSLISSPLSRYHHSDKSEKADNTSQSLYGLVYTRKQLLLEAFLKIDATGQGLVTVEQWADVMKQVSE